MTDVQNIKWYNQIYLENYISQTLVNFGKSNLKEDFIEIIMHEKFGIIEFSVNNNILSINFKKCKNLDIKDSKKEEACCICYDSCKTVLSCNHHICKSCASNWVKHKKTCPICRSTNNFTLGYIFKIPLKAIYRLFV